VVVDEDDASRNEGMAGAPRFGMLLVLELHRLGYVTDDDIVVNLDADGQHSPGYFPEIIQ
jgi:hypothetical protein